MFLAGFALYQGWFLAHILYWVKHNPGDDPHHGEAAGGAEADKPPGHELQHRWVDYGRTSVHLKRAIVAAEDAKFVDHEGFDWEGIQRALEKNQRRGKVVAGGSTITQQLAKNLFLTGERSLLRKGQEAIITAMLEAVMDKRRILEIYLNVVEWGEGVFGAEAAARYYFGVSAAAVTRAAGGAACRHAAASAFLRSQSRIAVPGAIRRHHHGAHAGGAGALKNAARSARRLLRIPPVAARRPRSGSMPASRTRPTTK